MIAAADVAKKRQYFEMCELYRKMFDQETFNIEKYGKPFLREKFMPLNMLNTRVDGFDYMMQVYNQCLLEKKPWQEIVPLNSEGELS